MTKAIYAYLLYLGDNALILGHRNSEWCGHGPALELDIALTNIALDLIGQARLFYQYAATLSASGETEDSLAYHRDATEYKNMLLVEQPNGDWAQTVLRQFLFSTFQHHLYRYLQESKDTQLASICAKSYKEVSYHLRWSSEWVIRLGDGTPESHTRMKAAVENLWMFTGECFRPAWFEQTLPPAVLPLPVEDMQTYWTERVAEVFGTAGLQMPSEPGFQTGGKTGRHTEHLGYLLAEMQFMQRAYPNSTW